ncbi:hypothetical protein [Nocardioides sp. Soil796]|uniref:hypothetical protein n=1 Tax=Nocardioides sp. Soil796 TaxID=1736412 RepID=UPI000AF9672C|nr:hypothetical protein [Nocardioides sp. Soil796]
MSDPFVPPVVPARLPTWQELYPLLPYRFPLSEPTPVVRIPIKGPPPFNMVAVVHTRLPGLVTPADGNIRRLQIRGIPTALRVRGFDPGADPALHEARSSSAPSVRMLQASDDGDFLVACDATGQHQPMPGSGLTTCFDDDGRWLLDADTANMADGVIWACAVEVTSWVMFHEPAAVAGAPQPAPSTAEEGSSLATQARLLVDHYRDYLTRPGADVVQAGRELSQLSGQLAAAHLPRDAVTPQQMATDALAAFQPPEGGATEHVIALAEARHNLLVRLFESGMDAQAAPLAEPALSGYRTYAEREGADLFRVQRDFAEFVKPLLAIGLADAALVAQRGALSVLQRMVPSAGGELEHEISLAEARHNLVARLLDVQLVAEARPTAAATIRAYQDYAARPGADVERAVRNLRELASVVLTPAQLTDLAAQANEAADSLQLRG